MTARKLSPKMTTALRETFSAEVGISYLTDRTLVARSGIIESYLVSTNTGAALMGRGYLTPVKGIRVSHEPHSYFQRQQITPAGCEAIGRGMDEIVAWAWGQATAEYYQRSAATDLRYSADLPVEVGAVVGWTHRGEPMTGKITAIFGDDATIFGADRSGWTVSLDAIERVIELPAVDRWGGPWPMEGGAELAAEISTLPDLPEFPEGTPEYEAYGTELHAELEKFVKGEAPYEYTTRDDALLQVDLHVGRADRKALPIMPPAKPLTLLELIDQHGMALVDCREAFGGPDGPWREAAARRDALKAEINRRLSLVAGLIPAEVRQILDGHA